MEYLALIKAFSENPNQVWGHFQYPLRCVFPERLKFLQAQGLFKDLTSDDCEELNKWKAGLNAQSLSVVFSSSYPNNPSSMFGHTLIRLRGEAKSDLLDYSVAFSAWQDVTESGFFMAVKGLVGGYRGLVEISKYYQKVNEYNFYESRDLIEYPLMATNEERERFLNHLWEIYQTTYFDYYFMDENCSSLLFQLLKVTYQDKDLGPHKRAYYLPQELVESLYESKLIDESKLTVRHSLKKTFEIKFNSLTSNEKLDFFKIIEVQNLEANALENLATKSLETAVDFFYYQKARTKGQLETAPVDQAKRLHQTLVARSKKGQSPAFLVDYQKENVTYPNQAHKPRMLGLSVGENQKSSYVSLSYKPGLHYFTDSPLGYEKFQSFDLFATELSWKKKDSKIFLQNFTLIDLRSLHSWSFYDPQLSWMVNIFHNDDLYSKRQEASIGGGLAKKFEQFLVGGFLAPFVALEDKSYLGGRTVLLATGSIAHQWSWLIENNFRVLHKKLEQKPKQSWNELTLESDYHLESNLSLGFKVMHSTLWDDQAWKLKMNWRY